MGTMHVMRKTGLLVMTVAATGLLAISIGAGQATRARPQLRVIDLAPLVVKGERFRSLERVRLTVTEDGTSVSRRVRATRRGSFSASFANIVVDRCSSDFSAFAVGALGSRAAAKIPQPQCPPRLTPP
jgi:hypothetical protein